MLEPGVLAFARGALPPPPARVLEIGAGDGELAAALREHRYAVTAIDPKAEDGSGVERTARIDAGGALRRGHRGRLAAPRRAARGVLRAPRGADRAGRGARDRRARHPPLRRARDRLVAAPAQRGRGTTTTTPPESILDGMRGHIHALDDVLAALAPHFTLGEPVRGPYLHRWHLPPGLREVEERLIGSGDLPATGARLVGIRGGRG